MKKQSHHALATHTHKAASLKAKAAKVAVRGATPPHVPPPLARSVPKSVPRYSPPNEHLSNGKGARNDRQAPHREVEEKNEHEASDGAQRSTGEPQHSVNSASGVTMGTTTTWIVCGLSLLLWALV
jgi:hypothetical protein